MRVATRTSRESLRTHRSVSRRSVSVRKTCSSAALFSLVLLCLGQSSSTAQPVLFEGNGNYYELVVVQTTWAAANAGAAARSFLGVDGHLATVTSSAENEFISSTFATGEAQFFSWLAGYEPNDNGVWLWGAGPENGVQFSQGGTATPPYSYANWGGIEPNDFAVGEDFLAMNIGFAFAGISPGQWGDSPNPNPADPIHGYVVEYETATPVHGLESAGQLGPAIRAISPNPIGETAIVHLTTARGSAMELVVFDSAGRRIRTLLAGAAAQSFQAVAWDGRDDRGVPAASGVYFFALRSDGLTTTRKAILAR